MPVVIEGLMKIADPKKILYGGDFPYTPASMLSHKRKALMEHPLIVPMEYDDFRDNALRIFGRI